MILAHKGGEVMTRMMMMTPGGDELVCVGGKSVHPLRDQGQLGQQQGRGGAEEHQEEQAAASWHLFQVDTFTFSLSLLTPCETLSLFSSHFNTIGFWASTYSHFSRNLFHFQTMCWAVRQQFLWNQWSSVRRQHVPHLFSWILFSFPSGSVDFMVVWNKPWHKHMSSVCW